MTNTFEEDIFNVMEKYLSNEELTLFDLKNCREICNLYEDKVKALNLTKLLVTYCNNKFGIDLSNKTDKIVILNTEFTVENNEKNGNNNTSNALNSKDKFNKITAILPNLNRINLTYEYVYDNFKNTHTFHKFNIDGNLILKKDHSNTKKTFINLSYIKEMIEKNNLKLTIFQFLDSFLNLLNVTNIFKVMLSDIEKHPEKYFFNLECSSESEISSIDDNSESDNDLNNSDDNKPKKISLDNVTFL